MSQFNKRALALASVDPVFSAILFGSNPKEILEKLDRDAWLKLIPDLTTNGWFQAAVDCKSGKYLSPDRYSSDSSIQRDIEKVQIHFKRFVEYRTILSSASDAPFSDYLYGMSVEDFRELMLNLRGMDSAREIQRLYKDGILEDDLGGSQLYRYMKDLNLPYIPSVSKLNEAKRGEIPRRRYNMTKSTTQD